MSSPLEFFYSNESWTLTRIYLVSELQGVQNYVLLSAEFVKYLYNYLGINILLCFSMLMSVVHKLFINRIFLYLCIRVSYIKHSKGFFNL